jgi:hypothetical protein
LDNGEQLGCRYAAALWVSFSRHGEIFPSDGGATAGVNAPAHRLDESPVGYSLAGWSPPEPASASPTRFSILQNGLTVDRFFIDAPTPDSGQKSAQFSGNISE